MSVEAIQNKIYSTKSDVWSFGVVCWEGTTPYLFPIFHFFPKLVLLVLSRGDPFHDLDPVNAAMKIVYENLRLSIPPTASEMLSDIMTRCW